MFPIGYFAVGEFALGYLPSLGSVVVVGGNGVLTIVTVTGGGKA